MRLWIVALSVVLVGVGCGDTTEYGDGNNGGNNGNNGNNGANNGVNNGGNNGANNGGNNGAPDEWFACNAHSDCAVFEAECCDHCNGGRGVSVHEDYLDEAREALQIDPDTCDQPCTLRACEPLVGVCDQGRCEAQIGGVGACDELEEDACAADPNCTAINGAPANEICVEEWDRWNQVFAGCMPADQGCGAAETCAIHPRTGQRHIFPSTCTPAGWTGCNTQPCDVAGACEDSVSTEPSRVCVQGVGGGPIEVGARLEVVVRPEGCFSSSCTRRADVFCAVRAMGRELSVEANFCLADIGGDNACTDDCGGGGEAICYSPTLEEGAYTVRLGDNGLDFEVPSDAPPGELCFGDGF